MLWFTPQISAMTRTGSAQSLELLLGIPQGLQGPNYLGALPDSWVRSGAAET